MSMSSQRSSSTPLSWPVSFLAMLFVALALLAAAAFGAGAYRTQCSVDDFQTTRLVDLGFRVARTL